MAWLPPSATTTTALFHWGHRVCHANSEAPAATICRDNHSMPSWSPSPLLTSHAWMCQLLLQHNLNRPKFSVIDSMLIQLSTSWFQKITQSVKIIHLPKCPCFQYLSQSSKVNIKGTRYYINFITLNLRAYILFNDQILFFDLYLLGNAIQNQFWYLKNFALSMILQKKTMKMIWYLFVGKDEQRGFLELLLLDELGKLVTGLGKTVPVTAVYHKYNSCNRQNNWS